MYNVYLLASEMVGGMQKKAPVNKIPQKVFGSK